MIVIPSPQKERPKRNAMASRVATMTFVDSDSENESKYGIHNEAIPLNPNNLNGREECNQVKSIVNTILNREV